VAENARRGIDARAEEVTVPRLPELQARIQALGKLGEVVSALRTVSAARVQQAHAILDAIRDHTEIIREALASAVRMAGVPSRASDTSVGAGVIIALGSEHGFVGAFNERLLDIAAGQRHPGDDLFVVGARATLLATERRDSVAWSCQMPSQVGGVDEVALRLAERVSLVGGQRRVERVSLVYTRLSAGAGARVVTEPLLPFDMQPYRAEETHRPKAISNLAPLPLIDGLVDELLFAQLAHAATESFASENAARLGVMQAAIDNVNGKLDDLGRLERELRQEEITTELLDLVTGAEAVIDA
jgi:F-type H+-transporting ATPase subunit gamma